MDGFFVCLFVGKSQHKKITQHLLDKLEVMGNRVPTGDCFSLHQQVVAVSKRAFHCEVQRIGHNSERKHGSGPEKQRKQRESRGDLLEGGGQRERTGQ